MTLVHAIVAAGLVACAWAPVAAAPQAASTDGRWRVEGDGAAVVVRDAGRVARTLPAADLGGHEAGRVADVHYLPRRRSFVIVFAGLPELWELSVDADAPPVYDGLVHDWRLGEAVPTPGFLGVRRTRLPAPAATLRPEDGQTPSQPHVLVSVPGAELLVHLEVRRVIARFALQP